MALRAIFPCNFGGVVLLATLLQAPGAMAKLVDISDLDEISSQIELAKQRGASYLEKKRAESGVDARAFGANSFSLHADAERASSLMQSATHTSKGIFQGNLPRGALKMQPQGNFNPFKPDPVLQAGLN
mmetsp:Transcript_90700/g.256106  ORF Transcript_90700/g.256106 Transcript_90700/m.256106 type:complete len:129 (-) Transcript_90700:115-501(-)